MTLNAHNSNNSNNLFHDPKYNLIKVMRKKIEKFYNAIGSIYRTDMMFSPNLVTYAYRYML